MSNNDESKPAAAEQPQSPTPGGPLATPPTPEGRDAAAEEGEEA
jgi:hypothetical protein